MQRLGGARRVRLQPRSFGVSPHAWASVLSPERAFDLSGTSNSHPVSNSEVVESAYAPPLVVFAADGAWSIYGVSCDRRVAASSAHVWASRVRFAERATRYALNDGYGLGDGDRDVRDDGADDGWDRLGCGRAFALTSPPERNRRDEGARQAPIVSAHGLGALAASRSASA